MTGFRFLPFVLSLSKGEPPTVITSFTVNRQTVAIYIDKTSLFFPAVTNFITTPPPRHSGGGQNPENIECK